MKKIDLCVVLAMLLIAFVGCANKNGAVAEAGGEVNLSGWMAGLADTIRVCKVSLPGTHDALTGEGFVDPKNADGFTTHVAGLDEQLKGGIRFFDVRLIMVEENGRQRLMTSHASAVTKLPFDGALEKVKRFLAENASEFVIIKIQNDGGGMTDEVHAEWCRMIQQLLTGAEYKDMFVGFRPDVTVGEIRGKVLLLSRDEYGEPVCGALTNWPDEGDMDYVRVDSVAEHTLVLSPCKEACHAYQGADNELAARLFVQDFYCTAGNRIEEKKRAVEMMYNSAVNVPENENVWVINHTSGFASEDANAIGYAENAEKANGHLLEILQKAEGRKSIGIIAMDYACVDTLNQEIGTLGVVKRNVMSRSLTKAIIESNFQ